MDDNPDDSNYYQYRRSLQPPQQNLQVCNEPQLAPFICTCTESELDNIVTVLCLDLQNKVCNDNNKCAQLNFGTVYDASTQEIISQFDQYILEDGTKIEFDNGGVFPDIRPGSTSCTVSINDFPCDSCEWINCEEGLGYEFNCNSLIPNAYVYKCFEDPSLDVLEPATIDNIFAVLDFTNQVPSSTPEEACIQTRDEFIANNEFLCSCDAANPTRVVLTCEETCGDNCNPDATICFENIFQMRFNIFSFSARQESTFTIGSNVDSTVTTDMFDCVTDANGLTFCDSCEIQVNGRDCDTCTIQNCTQGDVVVGQGAIVNCNRVQPGVMLDLCNMEDKQQFGTDDSVFQVFNDEIFAECSTLGQRQCLESAELFETNNNTNTNYDDNDDESLSTLSCGCEYEPFSKSSTLTCINTCGERCNQAQTLCGRDSFSELFNENGDRIITANKFQYTLGDFATQEVTLEVNDFGCFVTVGFGTCENCIIQQCPDGTTSAPLITCERIESGAILNLCQPDTLGLPDNMLSNSLFQFLSSAQLDNCIDFSQANGFCSVLAEPLNIPADGTELIVESSTLFGFPIDGETCFGDPLQGPAAWFVVIGTGSGIVVSTCTDLTDFDTVIEIFEGTSCDSLLCINENDDNDDCSISTTSSRLHWLAQEGTMYHIRVRGFGSMVGNFGLSVAQTNFAMEECRLIANDEVVFFSDITEGLQCDCTPVGDLQAELTCINNCEYCNQEKDSCVSFVYGSSFDAIGLETFAHETFTYTSGTQQGTTIRIEEFDCNEFRCNSCRMFINDQECNSCERVLCFNEGGQFIRDGIEINCINYDGLGNGESFSTCDPETVPQTGVFELFATDEYNECIQSPLQACETMATYQREEVSMGIDTCSCDGDETFATLICLDKSCVYCNDNDSICAERTYGFNFNFEGQIESEYTTYTYIAGPIESTSITVTDFMDEDLGIDRCTAFVNEDQCVTCQFENCIGQNGFSLPTRFIQCNSIDNDDMQFYSQCDESYMGSALQALQPGELSCRQPDLDPAEACQTLASGSFFGCDCTPNLETGGQTLTCSDSDCLFCNEERQMCGSTIFGNEFSRYGTILSFYNGLVYENGDRVIDIDYYNGNVDCAVEANDVFCNSCERIDCTDSFGFVTERKLFDCTNVDENVGIFGGCELPSIASGVLQFYSEGEYEICFDPEIDSEAVCQERAIFEAQFGSFCTCTANDNTNGHVLDCRLSSCTLCNDSADTCGFVTLGAELDRFGEVIYDYDGFQYSDGRTDTIKIDALFDATTDEFTCRVSVNEMECTSCEYITCLDDDGFSYTGRQVVCDNVPDGTNFNECEGNEKITGVFAYYSSTEFLDCAKNPQDACEQFRNDYEDSIETGTSCTCEPNNNVNTGNNDNGDNTLSPSATGYTLVCKDTACQYCNQDETTCVIRVGYGFGIDVIGRITESFDFFQYIQGPTTSLSKNSIVEVEGFGTDNCQVRVNGEFCQTCINVLCYDAETDVEFDGIEINCENVISTAGTYNCGTATGLLSPLAADGEYDVCIPYDGTFPPLPTDTPTMAPSMKPSQSAFPTVGDNNNGMEPSLPTTPTSPSSAPAVTTSPPSPTTPSPMQQPTLPPPSSTDTQATSGGIIVTTTTVLQITMMFVMFPSIIITIEFYG